MARRGPLTRGREGKCVSVGGYEDGGKARFCLEVQERKLIQFKGPHNSLPAGADLAAAVRYVEESRLKVSGRNLSGNVEAGEQAQAAGEGGGAGRTALLRRVPPDGGQVPRKRGKRGPLGSQVEFKRRGG